MFQQSFHSLHSRDCKVEEVFSKLKRNKERSSIYSLDKLSIVVPFDFFFVAGEHGIWSGLFEEAAFAATLNKDKFGGNNGVVG